MKLYISYTVVLNDWVVTTEAAASGIAIAAPASRSCWYRYNDSADGESLADGAWHVRLLACCCSHHGVVINRGGCM